MGRVSKMKLCRILSFPRYEVYRETESKFSADVFEQISAIHQDLYQVVGSIYHNQRDKLEIDNLLPRRIHQMRAYE